MALTVMAACWLAGSPADANDTVKKGSAHNTVASRAQHVKPIPAATIVAKVPKEPGISVNVTIGTSEREVIRTYARGCTEAPKGRKAKGLPPGLAKKAARGGELPPGWQKKCMRGEVLPAEVYRHCQTLPHEILVKLPPPPTGTILVAIDGKVMRLIRATREILDVFDLH